MTASLITPVHVLADEDYSDTAYWTDLCTNSATLDEDDMKACEGYRDYVSSQSDALNEQLKEIDAKREEISNNLAEYVEKIKNYESEINDLNEQIEALDKQIADKQKEIDDKQADIDEEQALIDDKQEEVDDLRSAVGDRIEQSQDTMRLNKYFDVLMGVSTFEDFIRVANTLSDMTNYNRKSMLTLNDLIVQLQEIKAQLEKDKAALEEDKKQLESDQNEISDKQDSVIAMRYEAELVRSELDKQLAEQNTNREMITDDISDIQSTMKSISDQLDRIAMENAAQGNGSYTPSGTSGFHHPIPGAHLTPGAGSFMYASGALHLGADYGVNVVKNVTPVVAIGQGVILYTYNGCGDGYYGSPCGAFSNKWQTTQTRLCCCLSQMAVSMEPSTIICISILFLSKWVTLFHQVSRLPVLVHPVHPLVPTCISNCSILVMLQSSHRLPRTGMVNWNFIPDGVMTCITIFVTRVQVLHARFIQNPSLAINTRHLLMKMSFLVQKKNGYTVLFQRLLLFELGNGNVQSSECFFFT